MIDQIKSDCATLYERLSSHKIYSSLNCENAIKIFMQHHIYSVWDFMNLLKYLQKQFTCTSVPWRPYKSAKLSRLINEIVLEEESDCIDNQETSHFMYYYEAIKICDFNTSHISRFVIDLNKHDSYQSLISQPYIPKSSRKFMNATYDCINNGVISVAASFAFARESLVPSLFEPIIIQLNKTNNPKYNSFISYLNRHIELDGEQHSHLAFDMVNEIVENEQNWKDVKKSARKSLESRIEFWDDIYLLIKNRSDQ